MRVAVVWAVVGLACGSDRAPVSTVVVAAAGAPGTATPAPGAPEPAPAPALLAVRDRAHEVMSARCGQCHESHRASAVPAALAIFDLDHPGWPGRFDVDRFAAGLNRFGGAPDADRQAFVAWRDAELADRGATPAAAR